MSTTIAITMAGLGSRFREAGHTLPKYMISVRGRTLFDWSIGSLARFISSGSPFVFVVRAADDSEAFIAGRAQAAGIASIQVLALADATDGQATTARIACGKVAENAPFAIFNIDTAVEPNHLDPKFARGAGWLPCFDAPGEHWSFVRTDANGSAVEVREKLRISNHATVGFYWFRSAGLYTDCYDRYYAGARREEHGERYVAPLYNQLISDGEPVVISDIPLASVIPLGTPEEVMHFEREGAPLLQPR